GLHRVEEGGVGDVRDVDDHAEVDHGLDHAHAERREGSRLAGGARAAPGPVAPSTRIKNAILFAAAAAPPSATERARTATPAFVATRRSIASNWAIEYA